MATLRPVSSATPRTISAFFRCMSCSPWEKLNLVTSTPARMSDPIVSSVEVAGPSVATIFVLRIGSGPSSRVESRPAGVEGRVPEGFLYAEELVVLGHALPAGRRAGFDLPGVHGHGEVGDRRILRLAAAVADHGRVTGFVGQLHGLERLGERADLVDLDEDGVADTLLDATPEYLGVRHEQVVAYELDPAPQPLRDHGPPFPVVLGEAVLYAQDGILVTKPGVVVNHLLPGELSALAGEVVLAVLVKLGGRGVEGEGNLVPQRITAPLDSLGDEPERRAVALQVGREPALVADAAGETTATERSASW